MKKEKSRTRVCLLSWFLLGDIICFWCVWRWGEVTGGSGSSISSWIWLWKNTKQESVDKPLHPALTLPLFTDDFIFSFFFSIIILFRCFLLFRAARFVSYITLTNSLYQHFFQSVFVFSRRGFKSRCSWCDLK